MKHRIRIIFKRKILIMDDPHSTYIDSGDEFKTVDMFVESDLLSDCVMAYKDFVAVGSEWLIENTSLK